MKIKINKTEIETLKCFLPPNFGLEGVKIHKWIL